MKKSIKNVVAGVLLSSTLGMTACFGGDPTIRSVEINNRGDNNFLVYDTIDPSDFVLNVTMSDGSTKTVNVTKDMIVESPDMTTAGQKTLKVEYEGKTYELKFNVGGYSKQDMLAKIQAFMDDYNANTNAGSLKVNVTGGYEAKYLEHQASGQIPADALEAIMQQSDFSSDALLKHLYSSVVGSLTESTSNNVTLDNIVNSNNLHSKVEVIKVLETLLQKVSNFNYASYILNTFMNSQGYQLMLNDVADGLVISFNLVGDQAKTELKSFIHLNLIDLVNYVKDLNNPNSSATFDAWEVIKEFNDLVQEYSDETVTKSTLQTIVDSIDEQDPHVLSTFFKALADNDVTVFPMYHYVVVDDPDSNIDSFELVHIENAETKAINKNVTTKLSSMIKAYEDIVLNMLAEDPQNMEELMTAMTDAMSEFVDSVYDEIGSTVYKCQTLMSIVKVVDIMYATILNYQASEGYADFVVKQLESFYVPEMLSKMITNEIIDVKHAPEEMTEAFRNSVNYFLHDILGAVLNGQLTLEKEKYLDNLALLIYEGSIDPAKKAQYEQEWDETGFCSIISDYFQDVVDQVEDEISVTLSYMDVLDSAVDIVRYLENSLRTSGQNKVEFSLETLVGLVDGFLVDGCNFYKEQIEKIEEEMENYVPEEIQPGVIILGDYVRVLEQLNSHYTMIDAVRQITNFEDKDFTALEFLNNISNGMGKLADYYNSEIERVEEEIANSGSGQFVTTLELQALRAQYNVFNTLSIITDFNDEDATFKGNIDKLIAEYKAEVKTILTDVATDILGIKKYVTEFEPISDEDSQNIVETITTITHEYTAARAVVASLMDYVVEHYITNDIDYEYVMNSYFNIINNHAHESVKVLSTASSLIAMVTIDKLTSEQIDYNELFSFIQLPDEIESIDYNQLVETFWSENTYKNMFSVSNVDVKYETNTQGEIAKEIMEVTLSFDYDLKVTSLFADLTLKFTVDF